MRSGVGSPHRDRCDGTDGINIYKALLFAGVDGLARTEPLGHRPTRSVRRGRNKPVRRHQTRCRGTYAASNAYQRTGPRLVVNGREKLQAFAHGIKMAASRWCDPYRKVSQPRFKERSLNMGRALIVANRPLSFRPTTRARSWLSIAGRQRWAELARVGERMQTVATIGD